MITLKAQQADKEFLMIPARFKNFYTRVYPGKKNRKHV
jgi:hypothetical protein